MKITFRTKEKSEFHIYTKPGDILNLNSGDLVINEGITYYILNKEYIVSEKTLIVNIQRDIPTKQINEMDLWIKAWIEVAASSNTVSLTTPSSYADELIKQIKSRY